MSKPQIVDPFIPARTVRAARLQSQSPPLSRVRPQSRSRSQSQPRSALHSQIQPRPRPQPPKAASANAVRPWSFEEPETWRDRPGKVVALAVGGLLLGGLSLFSLELGELALAVYAILAIWRRWPSRQAFAVTLGMFAGIMVTSLVSAWRQLADNLAVYAFLLLCVGTFLMAMEMRRDARRGTAANNDEVADDGTDQAVADGVYHRPRSL